MIGGRRYGPDNLAVVANCERLDTRSLTWKNIAPLNEPRCTSMQFLVNDKIYVAGGYYVNGERLRSIEAYDEERNVWEIFGRVSVIDKVCSFPNLLKLRWSIMMGLIMSSLEGESIKGMIPRMFVWSTLMKNPWIWQSSRKCSLFVGRDACIKEL